MMNTKTFRAPNVMVALEEVQRALGPDALVVSVRQVASGSLWQVWRKPEVEVIATTAKTANAANPPVLEETRERSSFQFGQSERTDPAAARSPFETVQRSGGPEFADEGFFGMGELTAPFSKGGPAAKVYRRLVEQGMDPALVQKVLQTCAETLSPRATAEEDRLLEYLAPQLQAYLRVRSERSFLADRVVCVVGLSGSGKTNTCAKLAAHQMRLQGRKVAWICADTVSTGAIFEARLFTEALNIPLHIAYTPEELAEAVAQEQKSDLILVDTPGCNPLKESSIIELGDLLTELPGRSTYMVAPATAKEADLNRLYTTLKPFNLSGIIITRLDETVTYGNVFNLAWRSQLPMVYFSNGARVPDDLHPAQSKTLVGALLGEGMQV